MGYFDKSEDLLTMGYFDNLDNEFLINIKARLDFCEVFNKKREGIP
jgi:hypothetical protein